MMLHSYPFVIPLFRYVQVITALARSAAWEAAQSTLLFGLAHFFHRKWAEVGMASFLFKQIQKLPTY